MLGKSRKSVNFRLAQFNSHCGALHRLSTSAGEYRFARRGQKASPARSINTLPFAPLSTNARARERSCG